MKFPTTEPSSEMRNAAKMHRQYFVALVQEGFTESQALQILGYMLSAAVASAPPKDNNDV
jgi:hypothetical protein